LKIPENISFFSWDSSNIRLDIGYKEGNQITPFYDPLIAKLITRGKNREEAINTMLYALSSIEIEGVKTNIPFLKEAISSDLFRAGGYDTHFIPKLRGAEKV
jgi:acetyl/propionyl-CoA carboxylase alpha subunit